MIGAALLLFIAFAPLLRSAFGWGWPVIVALALGGGVYLIWPKAPAVRFVDVVCLVVIAITSVGLLALLPLGGGGVGHAVAALVESYVGGWGAGVMLTTALVLSLIVVFHFSPAATLGAFAAGLRTAHAERQRINALVARVRPGDKAAPKTLKATKAVESPSAPAMIPPAFLDLDETAEEPEFPRGGKANFQTPASMGQAPLPIDIEPDEAEEGEKPVMRVVAEPVDDLPEIDWKLPSLNLLDTVTARKERMADEIKRNVRILEHTLATFGVAAKVVAVNPGPAVTQYEVQPAEGVPVRKITSMANDLSLALAASPIRIEAPIPGKSAVGIEVPNKSASLVTIREVISSPAFQAGGKSLPLALGNDVSGQPIVGDLARMPHLLIAGATGQGKSVCINVLIASLLFQATPEQLRLMLIDPKRVEMSSYNGLPHLMVPVIVESHQATAALRWAVAEMDRRYRLLSSVGVRNIQTYNERAKSSDAKEMAYLVIVIDELADLMMVAAGEVEELVCRIAQLARAVGIHLVVATQRPSTDIITGLIKANIPSRIAFAVGSQVDSRVILDSGGAEKLLGRGDMLYQPVDAGKPTRVQGAFVSDPEVDAVVGWWKAQGGPRFVEEVLDSAASGELGVGESERKLDPLFARGARAVAAEGSASVSLIQRKFNVGYSRAGRIVDQLAEHRVVGGYQGSKSREILMNLPDVDELLERLGLE